ncbi:MAG: hypothetical protein GY838_10140 [bacterium]|nr:hypothetical protein [bacterium]
MKPLILATALLAIFVSGALAQPDIGHYPNEIGLFTTPDPTSASDTRLDAPTAGTYTIYLICSNPWNDRLNRPIPELGGFDLIIYLPSGWDFSHVNLPPGVFDLSPDLRSFYCSGLIPVVSDQVVLATIGIECAVPNAGGIRLAAYPGAASVPGSAAITDATDSFHPFALDPVTNDYGLPVMGINMNVVPADDLSWSEIKTLFK